MSAFNPLRTQRAIRDDSTLAATHKALLWVATLRADNDSAQGREAGRVRASLEMLASDANLSSKSAERAFRESEVLRYFRRVERRTRSVGLWFNLTTPDTESGVDKGTPDTESLVEPSTPDSLSTTPDTESDRLPSPLPKPASSIPRASIEDDVAGALGIDRAAAKAVIAAKLDGREFRGDGSGLIRSILRNSPEELRDLIPGAHRPLPPLPNHDLYGNFAAQQHNETEAAERREAEGQALGVPYPGRPGVTGSPQWAYTWGCAARAWTRWQQEPGNLARKQHFEDELTRLRGDMERTDPAAVT